MSESLTFTLSPRGEDKSDYHMTLTTDHISAESMVWIRCYVTQMLLMFQDLGAGISQVDWQTAMDEMMRRRREEQEGAGE